MTMPTVTIRRLTISRPAISQMTLGVAACALLAACSNAPTETRSVAQAGASYEAARNDPRVVNSAPLELQRAEQALRAAQDAQADGEDVAAVDHQAYLASRRADIAIQTAELRDAEKQIEQANQTRDQALLGARTGQVQSLQRQLEDLKAQQTDRGMVVTLGDVLFETGRADLRSGSERTIGQLANFMQQNPSRTVEVTGFTDSTGSVELNQELSERRAEAVRQALVSYGISPQRIVTRGLGPALPVASNNTAAGRQQNRRVEITISDEKGSIPPRA
jgi:outer membrane protein OmpA-like peptidoglycan-associated protein